jgi:hypothetical protein
MDMSNVSGTTVWPGLGYFYLGHWDDRGFSADSLNIHSDLSESFGSKRICAPKLEGADMGASCSWCSNELAMMVVH